MSDTREFDPAAVPIRPAATVMLVRSSATNALEVFMLRRTLRAAFGGGMYVYPGGRVEAADGDDLDRAHRLAAIRECFEEAGVLLAHDRSGVPVADGHPVLAERMSVHDGEVDLVGLCNRHELTLDLDSLAWVAHWLTPVGETRRFDTRFFLALAPPAQSSVHDDTETIASMWIRPEEALERHSNGEMIMMIPTVTTLRFLAEHDTVDAALAAGRAMPPPQRITPHLRVGADGRMIEVVVPGGQDDGASD